MHAPGEGRLGEGATALRNKQQGEKGAREGLREGRGGRQQGQGRRRSPRSAQGLVAGHPKASETRDGCGTELTADTERHTPSPSPAPPSPLLLTQTSRAR